MYELPHMTEGYFRSPHCYLCK